MTDEIRVTREDDTLAAGTHQHGRELRNKADVEAVIPPDPDAHVDPTVTTDDPDAVRAEIEHTRARMSETIDEIEDVIVRKKEEIQDRLDFLAPVRARPLASLGAVFGAGLLLGLLTGGDDEDEDEDHYEYDPDEFEHSQDRAEMWERRARRLLRIAREQEEEIEALSSGRAAPLRARAEEDEWEEEEHASFDLRDTIAEKVGDFFTHAIRQLFAPGPRLG